MPGMPAMCLKFYALEIKSIQDLRTSLNGTRLQWEGEAERAFQWEGGSGKPFLYQALLSVTIGKTFLACTLRHDMISKLPPNSCIFIGTLPDLLSFMFIHDPSIEMYSTPN